MDFVEQSLSILAELPKGYSELSSQLKRAAFSVSLNIAEGAGKSAKLDKKRFYEIARGSAMESAAICDILFRASLLRETFHRRLKELLQRIISMLSRLSMNLGKEK